MAKDALPKGSVGRPHSDPGRDVQTQLLNAVERCLEKKEIDEIGIRDIANEANVNSAMINYYFGSKHGLFVAMYSRLEKLFSERLRQLEHGLTPASRDTVERLVQIQNEFYLRHQALFKLVWRDLRERGDDSDGQPQRSDQSSIVYERVVSLIRRMMQLDLIRHDINVEYAAYIIVSLCGHPFVMGAMFERNSGIQFTDLENGRWPAYVARVIEDHLFVR
jgi:AcrR family transcriptional regulator